VTICLVTDRRRQPVVEQVRAAAEAGVDVCQIRERDLEARSLAALVGEALAAARGTGTRVVVNDRLDVALACGADGVHLRADSIPPALARTVVPKGFLIGRSVHGVDEARLVAADVDYLIAGTVFRTPSKPGQSEWLGVAGLAAISAAVNVPVWAIGGVSPDTVGAIQASGAAGIAAIGLFAVAPAHVAAVVADLRQAWRDGAPRSSFDTAKRGS
jgi:thiamine-phosphate pyrophosphorylase